MQEGRGRQGKAAKGIILLNYYYFSKTFFQNLKSFFTRQKQKQNKTAFQDFSRFKISLSSTKAKRKTEKAVLSKLSFNLAHCETVHS